MNGKAGKDELVCHRYLIHVFTLPSPCQSCSQASLPAFTLRSNPKPSQQTHTVLVCMQSFTKPQQASLSSPSPPHHQGKRSTLNPAVPPAPNPIDPPHFGPPSSKRRRPILNRDILPRPPLELPPQLVGNLLVLRLLEGRLVVLRSLAEPILLDGVDA